MDVKQGKEDTKFIKEADDSTVNFILQKNNKTKIAITIIVIALVIMIIGILLSGYFFESTNSVSN